MFRVSYPAYLFHTPAPVTQTRCGWSLAAHERRAINKMAPKPLLAACSDALLERDFSHLRRSKVHYCDYNGCPPVSSHCCSTSARKIVFGVKTALFFRVVEQRRVFESDGTADRAKPERVLRHFRRRILESTGASSSTAGRRARYS